MYNAYQPSPTLISCTFTENTATDSNGGGMHNNNNSPTLIDCTFIKNVATGVCGGGMHNELSSSPTLINCTFSENTAPSGGGMENSYSASPTLTNCTFRANKAGLSGGAMYNTDDSSPTLTNCILWADSAPLSGNEIYNDPEAGEPSTPVVTYSCVADGYPGAGNISTDPMLVGTTGANGRIRPASPCINAGTTTGAPDTDIRGVDRPQGSGIDMGAYELDDSDSDGISDRWELNFFGKLTAASASSDADNDRFTDLNESLYGSDPFDMDSDGGRFRRRL